MAGAVVSSVYIHLLSGMLPLGTPPQVGDAARAFELVEPDGTRWTLEQWAGKPILLVFYRGHW